MSLVSLDIITASLEKLEVYAPGEVISDADAERSLSELNSMVNEWMGQFIFINQLVTVSATLAIAKAQYSIGLSGADVTQARPQKVQYGPAQASVTISATTTPVNVVSAVEWKFIESISPGAGTPNTLWYDNQYPLGFLNLAPTPSAIGTLQFSSKTPLSSFADLSSTSYTLGVGVQNALQDNLAVRLKSYFLKSDLPPEVVANAVMGKRFIRYQGVTSRAMLGRMDRGGVQITPPAQSSGG